MADTFVRAKYHWIYEEVRQKNLTQETIIKLNSAIDEQIKSPRIRALTGDVWEIMKEDIKQMHGAEYDSGSAIKLQNII